jgi:hypothetical protein
MSGLVTRSPEVGSIELTRLKELVANVFVKEPEGTVPTKVIVTAELLGLYNQAAWPGFRVSVPPLPQAAPTPVSCV